MAGPAAALSAGVTQIVLLLVALGAATAFGLWRRRTDGRIKVVDAAPSRERSGAAEDVVAPSFAGAPTSLGDSEPLMVDGHPLEPTDHTVVPAEDVLTAAEIGGALGERATLVQFSSAFCQPCRATRLVLAEIADIVPGVSHVEIDAEAHLDLVRAVDVTRTPTVLFLDRQGRIRRRATGAPRRQDVLTALAEIV